MYASNRERDYHMVQPIIQKYGQLYCIFFSLHGKLNGPIILLSSLFRYIAILTVISYRLQSTTAYKNLQKKSIPISFVVRILSLSLALGNFGKNEKEWLCCVVLIRH